MATGAALIRVVQLEQKTYARTGCYSSTGARSLAAAREGTHHARPAACGALLPGRAQQQCDSRAPSERARRARDDARTRTPASLRPCQHRRSLRREQLWAPSHGVHASAGCGARRPARVGDSEQSRVCFTTDGWDGHRIRIYIATLITPNSEPFWHMRCALQGVWFELVHGSCNRLIDLVTVLVPVPLHIQTFPPALCLCL